MRNLSGSLSSAANANVVTGGQNSSITVAFPAAGPKAKLELDYIRLPSWRSIPATRTLSAYRVSCHDATSGKDAIVNPQLIAGACLDSGVAKNAIAISGVDRAGNRGGGAGMAGDRYQECEWSGVVMSQIPTYIAVLLQKSTDAYTHDNFNRQGTGEGYTAQAAIAADRTDTSAFENQFLARNTASSASVVALDLMIQSSVGSYTYSNEAQYLKGRSELFKDTLKNSYLDYMQGCEFNWDKHNAVVFLESSSFARGLGSEGSSMPVVFQVKARFENHREFIDGTGAASSRARGPAVVKDALYGTPLLLAFFPRMSLALSPSAGLVSSQNISHASALQLLSQTQS